MSTLGPFLISILLTTVSVMAFPLAILPIFAEVKPIEKKQLSSREMKLAIALLGLYILGFVNLYAIWNIGNKNPGEPDGGDPIVDSQGPAGQDGEDAPSRTMTMKTRTFPRRSCLSSKIGMRFSN